ncbi:lipocalin-like domain-containing protein [Georgenia yuyongxinii]|uniref:Lipocalin-like domain-containing protein n=2 Tax=Georgenia yuyongxinii TaxID=2589797 RepID=A0A5B8C6H3_9MICO|nr:lipocalin-like domain-containing protein [Georgenia yuyongxinii]
MPRRGGCRALGQRGRQCTARAARAEGQEGAGMSDVNEGRVRDRSDRRRPSLAEQLVGAWALVSWTEDVADGTATLLGEDPDGLLLFTPDGYSSVRIRAAADDADGGAGASHVASAGPFHLDERTGRLAHMMSPVPGHGFGEEFLLEVDGDLLTLTTHPLSATPQQRLVWRRAEPRVSDHGELSASRD